MQELIYEYDGTWEGLLSLIFESFEHREIPLSVQIHGEKENHLFSQVRKIHTDLKKSTRVAKGIKRHSKKTFSRMYRAYLSEKKEREIICLQVAHLLFKNPKQAESDYRNPFVLKLKQIEKEMGREIHRMHAFVRFQKGVDDIWYAFIQPDFDVNPLIGIHFKNRYADQKWVIYDLKRKYGMYYDLERLQSVTLDFEDKIQEGKLPKEASSSEEIVYQHLWKNYFESVNIKERKNMRLHIQHVPKRYWNLLPEINA